MVYDKRKGSLLNYIQRPLNVVTPYGTYLGLIYDSAGLPQYVLSHVRVKTYPVSDLIFSKFSKDYIIRKETPILEVNNKGKIGYGYSIADIERDIGYITVSSKRIDITDSKITKPEAEKILDKQLRNIGNVLENFVTQELSQTQYDALLVYFYYAGLSAIETSSIIDLINNEQWYDITDEFQTNIMRSGNIVDETLATRMADISSIWAYVPGF